MSRRTRLQLAAAASRLVLGALALTLLPIPYPGLAAWRGLFLGYLAIAAVLQVLIWRGWGGRARAVVGGVIDTALITFLVHRVGSAGTMMVAIYFFSATVNALVVGRRFGLALACTSALLYTATVAAEAIGWLPYAPDAAVWARLPPGPAEAAVLCGLLSILLLSSALLVGMLVDRIQQRERELVAANARLEELSTRDPLTQLFNRRYLMQRLEDELARVRRGKALAVVMIDLDGFKRVNDDHGHERGDEVLQQISAALSKATREVDVAGRYGGDEFVVLLPDTDPAHGALVARRLAAAVKEAGLALDPANPITASVGVAFALPSDHARALVRRADFHAYRAKEAGGDRVSADVEQSGELSRVAIADALRS